MVAGNGPINERIQSNRKRAVETHRLNGWYQGIPEGDAMTSRFLRSAQQSEHRMGFTEWKREKEGAGAS